MREKPNEEEQARDESRKNQRCMLKSHCSSLYGFNMWLIPTCPLCNQCPFLSFAWFFPLLKGVHSWGRHMLRWLLTLTSLRESRNLSWRLVSMCSWLPVSLSACSLVLGRLVWSPGASSMSISTSYRWKGHKNIKYWKNICLLATLTAGHYELEVCTIWNWNENVSEFLK